MLSEDQVKNIKEQLLKHIESFPEEQREAAREQIEEMDSETLEAFLAKNNIPKPNQEQMVGECLFCSIIQDKIKSYKIAENKKALAILELKPLSHGHSMVLSKEHDKLPSQALTMASSISKKLKDKLKADDVKIESSLVMGHNVINIVPLYKDKKLERKQVDEAELVLVQEQMKQKKSVKKETKTGKIKELKTDLEKAPRRIP